MPKTLNEKTLIVDDDESNRPSLIATLGQWGDGGVEARAVAGAVAAYEVERAKKICLRIKDDLDAFLDGRVTLEPNSAFLLHLTACRNCCRAFEARVIVRHSLRNRIR
jgi:hypothetical protein